MKDKHQILTGQVCAVIALILAIWNLGFVCGYMLERHTHTCDHVEVDVNASEVNK